METFKRKKLDQADLFHVNGSVKRDLFKLKHIMLTWPCNEDPLTPHFYIVKLGFTGVYIIFLILL